MSAGFTKGPWEISFEAPRWIIQADHGPGKKALAFLVGDFVKCRDDARLIAAAPALYEALLRWSNIMAQSGVWPVEDANDPMQDALAQTHAALKQARGDLVDPSEQVEL